MEETKTIKEKTIELPEYLQAEELNEETNQKLFEFLSHYIL